MMMRGCQRRLVDLLRDSIHNVGKTICHVLYSAQLDMFYNLPNDSHSSYIFCRLWDLGYSIGTILACSSWRLNTL